MNDNRKRLNTLETRILRVTVGVALVCGVIILKHRRLVPIEGHFIRKDDFQRMLTTGDRLVMQTPLGEFRVTPI